MWMDEYWTVKKKKQQKKPQDKTFYYIKFVLNEICTNNNPLHSTDFFSLLFFCLLHVFQSSVLFNSFFATCLCLIYIIRFIFLFLAFFLLLCQFFLHLIGYSWSIPVPCSFSPFFFPSPLQVLLILLIFDKFLILLYQLFISVLQLFIFYFFYFSRVFDYLLFFTLLSAFFSSNSFFLFYFSNVAFSSCGFSSLSPPFSGSSPERYILACYFWRFSVSPAERLSISLLSSCTLLSFSLRSSFRVFTSSWQALDWFSVSKKALSFCWWFVKFFSFSASSSVLSLFNSCWCDTGSFSRWSVFSLSSCTLWHIDNLSARRYWMNYVTLYPVLIGHFNPGGIKNLN